MHQGSVLIVEDDSALRHSVKSMLEALDFQVEEAWSGEIALSQLRANLPEVVLLDLNMPGMGGVTACSKMRELYPQLSIIVLTVRDSDEDKISALDAGADDYISKPFRLPELAARLRAAVRRNRQPRIDANRTIEIGPFRLDPLQHRVSKNGNEVHLTPKEFELLQYLMQHAGRPLSHSKLLSHVWGQEYGGEREYLRTYISQLRRKLEDSPAEPQYLSTENYIGYRFQLS